MCHDNCWLGKNSSGGVESLQLSGTVGVTRVWEARLHYGRTEVAIAIFVAASLVVRDCVSVRAAFSCLGHMIYEAPFLGDLGGHHICYGQH